MFVPGELGLAGHLTLPLGDDLVQSITELGAVGAQAHNTVQPVFLRLALNPLEVLHRHERSYWLASAVDDNPLAAVRNLTEQFAQVAVVGPESRRLLERLGGMDLSKEALPFMHWADGTVGGFRARVYRISFSGELSFEVAVPASEGRAFLWVGHAASQHARVTQRSVTIRAGRLANDTQAVSHAQ